MSANLTWIDNLISGGKKLPDHNKAYIREYIAEFGERKVEANALVVRPDVARELVESAINEYLPANASEKMDMALEVGQARIEELSEKADVDLIISDLVDSINDIINKEGE